MSKARFHLKARDRTLDRLTYALRVATGPTFSEAGAIPLPRPLEFLHRAVRPLRLAGLYGPRLLRRRPGSSATEDSESRH